MSVTARLGALSARYAFLLQQLVLRDFKVKYKRSVLGVGWSLLYPLLTTAIMSLVFSNVFRFSTPGVSYVAYLLTGLVFYNYFSEGSNLAMSSILANGSLIGKVYVPKAVFPLSKCLSSGINFLLSLLPLYLVLLLTGTGLCWQHVFLPWACGCLFLFTLGVGLLLAAAAVFLRDIVYLYGVVLTLWMYLTPIMYDVSIISSPLLRAAIALNPLAQYIGFARTVLLLHRTPEAGQFALCALSAIGTLLVGLHIFRCNQDKFYYYM